MTPDDFAFSEYRDYVIYRELEKIERNAVFKKLLQQLMHHEFEHYHFWLQFSTKKDFSVGRLTILFFIAMRYVLGLTFTAKYLEKHEREAIELYTHFLSKLEGQDRKRLEQIIEHEKYHEQVLINHIQEGKVQFMSSIILGLNDALIEITGSLVGFSFVFQNTSIVALSGFIMGIAASLSMASSGYMQARYDERQKNAKKAAIYTGITYFAVVVFLVLPFFLTTNTSSALLLMGIIVLLIITGISFYGAFLFNRNFKKECLTMVISSVGVATVSFLIGSLFRTITGIRY